VASDILDDVNRLADDTPDRVTPIQQDIAAAAAPGDLVDFAMRHYGQLDILVNNAGINLPKPMVETTDEDFDRVMGINTTSVFRLSRAAVGVMHEGSAIVNVASVFGLRGDPNSAAYAASKAAIVGLTRQMAAEHGFRGIRVNAVAPGLIVTDMTRERIQSSRRFQQLLVETTPFPRLGQPDDVAAAVNFLASDEAGFISGQVLAVDGGWLAANNRPADTTGA
jgi:meso-butanediol dehydrogenase / (S,S)-butanediol dehydrogenase / diacetyl reductase